MADKPGKKRLVKNPETFRERAQKASQEEDKPDRNAKLKQARSTAAAPLRRTSSKLGQVPALKPFRWFFGLLGKVLVPKYVRNSWQELKQVNWPNWHTSRRLTFAVLVFAVIFGLTVAGVDYVLDKIFREFLLS